MDYIDYREKLNIGFNDKEKFGYFINCMTNRLKLEKPEFSAESYLFFVQNIGESINQYYVNKGIAYDRERYSECLSIIKNHEKSLSDYLAVLVTFINVVQDGDFKEYLREALSYELERSHIQYELYKDDDGEYIFPCGAKLLDDALVSEPLLWLKDYPKAYETYSHALRQYANRESVRDCADNFRKAFETFLQEILGNEKNLQNNKAEICKKIGGTGIEPNLGSMIDIIIEIYRRTNDEYVKHNDKLDESLLEFVMYQTGVIIRTIIKVLGDEKSV